MPKFEVRTFETYLSVKHVEADDADAAAEAVLHGGGCLVSREYVTDNSDEESLVDCLPSDTEIGYDINQDQICIKWSTEDVMGLDETLTIIEARDVLSEADRLHDAEHGINWDTLKYYVGELIRER